MTDCFNSTLSQVQPVWKHQPDESNQCAAEQTQKNPPISQKHCENYLNLRQTVKLWFSIQIFCISSITNKHKQFNSAVACGNMGFVYVIKMLWRVAFLAASSCLTAANFMARCSVWRFSQNPRYSVLCCRITICQLSKRSCCCTTLSNTHAFAHRFQIIHVRRLNILHST